MVMVRVAGTVLVSLAGVWAVLAAQARPGPSTPPGPDRPPVAQTGAATELWRAEGAGRGTPAADAASVYALSRTGELLAIDCDTGVVRWRQRTSPPGSTTAGSSVRRWGRLVIAGDEDVVAVEADTGTPAWRFTPPDGYGVGHYLGGVSEGVVFTGSASGRLYAIDAVSGQQRWSAAPASPDLTTVFEPVAQDGLVVAGYTTFTAPVTGGVVAYDAADGRQRWRRPLQARDGSAHTHGWGNGLVLAGDRVIATGRDGTLWALSAFDGSPMWLLEPPADACSAGTHRPDIRPLTRSGHLVVAGSSTGCVTSYDLHARTVGWRYTDPRLGSVASRLASDDTLAYVPFLSGRVVALDLRGGAERWRVGDGTHEFVWAPALAGRRLYLTSPSGYFAYSR